jgi:hypothetical protein
VCAIDREIFKFCCRRAPHFGYVSLDHVAHALRDGLQVDVFRGFDSPPGVGAPERLSCCRDFDLERRKT